MSWTSFREKNVPPRRRHVRHADRPGMTVGCVNPARPGATDWVPLDSYWYAARVAGTRRADPLVERGRAATPYLRTEGLVSASCVNDGQRGYLSIRTNHVQVRNGPTGSAARSA